MSSLDMSPSMLFQNSKSNVGAISKDYK